MPLFTNIGGKLVEIESLNTTNDGILKPIYGTPKENMRFHWGGFTGESNTQYILIGTITLNCPTYVSVLLEIPDNTYNTLFTTPTDEFVTKYYKLDFSDGFHYGVEYEESALITFDGNSFGLTNWKRYLRTSTGWSLEKDFVKNTRLTNPILLNNSTTENLYNVTVNRRSFYRVYKYTKDGGIYSGTKEHYFPMDGMTADFTFTFQTLNNG